MLCMSLRNYERQSKKLTKLIAPFPDADDIYFRLFIHEEHDYTLWLNHVNSRRASLKWGK